MTHWMDLRFISLALSILFFSFLEIIVFDEEVLLALCFILFVFTFYNFLNVTVFEIFSDRAKKFEEDIFIAFETKQNTITSLIKDLLLSRTTYNALLIMESCIKNYSKFLIEAQKTSRHELLVTLTLSKLNNILASETTLKTNVKKLNIQVAIYPIIYSFINKKWDTKALLSNTVGKNS